MEGGNNHRPRAGSDTGQPQAALVIHQQPAVPAFNIDITLVRERIVNYVETCFEGKNPAALVRLLNRATDDNSDEGIMTAYLKERGSRKWFYFYGFKSGRKGFLSAYRLRQKLDEQPAPTPLSILHALICHCSKGDNRFNFILAPVFMSMLGIADPIQLSSTEQRHFYTNLMLSELRRINFTDDADAERRTQEVITRLRRNGHKTLREAWRYEQQRRRFEEESNTFLLP